MSEDDPDLDPDFDAVRLVEAILFASAQPMEARDLARRLPPGSDIAAILGRLRAHYAPRGVTLVEREGKWAFRTAIDLADRLRQDVPQNRKLSRAAVEVLAVIAYHQPATRAEIEEIRGVALSKGTLDTLFQAGWIHPRGRRPVPGRPLLWGTTGAFLDHFNLESVEDLPNLRELKASGLLDARPAADAYGNRAVDGGPPVDVDGEEDAAPEDELDEG
jgi:segregation and condensation protein B